MCSECFPSLNVQKRRMCILSCQELNTCTDRTKDSLTQTQFPIRGTECNDFIVVWTKHNSNSSSWSYTFENTVWWRFRVWRHGEWPMTSQDRIVNFTCNNLWPPKWSWWVNYDCLIISDLSTPDDSMQRLCHCLSSCIFIQQREATLVARRKTICVRPYNTSSSVVDQLLWNSRWLFIVRCHFKSI
jgi:hypothetical protein